MYRQGDVLIIPIPAPSDTESGVVVERENGRVILAHGEVTGHAHALAEPGVTLYQWGGSRYLEIAGTVPAVVGHEEHNAIALDPGWYEVRRQREYTPEEIRQVLD